MTKGVAPRPAIERIMERITISAEGCWEFPTRNQHGYGVVSVRLGPNYSRMRRAHRITYEHFVGQIPEGLSLDHLCRNPACCNPEHLEPVTHEENMRRGSRKQNILTCVKGHPFDKRLSNGRRVCSTCARERQRAYDQRLRDKKRGVA